jgi:hypothetical protein
MNTYTIKFRTSTGGQDKIQIQAESTNRARQKFKTLYPNVKILGSR